MTLSEIASWINRNERYKLTEEQIVLLIDMVNKLACDQDLPAFKYWENVLTPHTQLNYDVAGADPIPADIGTVVTGQTSGATGTVETYDTTDKNIVLSNVVGTFEAGEQITNPGTLDVTLLTEDWIEGYKGPYPWPTSPPVRKMVGVTTISDAAIYGTQSTFTDSSDDYGMKLTGYDDRRFFTPGRSDDFSRTFKFISAPNIDATSEPYRWVYFRSPETITDLDTDDAKLLVDPLFHMEFIQACIKAANVATEDGEFDRDVVERYFWGWWNRLRKNYTPMGKASNQTNQGNLEMSPNPN